MIQIQKYNSALNIFMKKLFLFIFIIVMTLCKLVAQSEHGYAHYTDKPSVHGMTLMGTEVIYASHLPMFHTPHDYQIILAIKLPEEAKAKYLAEIKANPQELLYTLEPEKFVLPEMVNHAKKFKAALYRGHFERGGTKFLENVTVEIQQVVYFKKFDTQAQRPDSLYYILFGNVKEQFLAHQISMKPDFDENISVKIADKKILKTLEKQPFIIVTFSEKEQRKAFSWATSQAQIQNTEQVVTFEKHQTFYLEFRDLD